METQIPKNLILAWTTNKIDLELHVFLEYILMFRNYHATGKQALDHKVLTSSITLLTVKISCLIIFCNILNRINKYLMFHHILVYIYFKTPRMEQDTLFHVLDIT